MNTKSIWINRRDREPTEADLPIMTTAPVGGKWRTQVWTEWTPSSGHAFSHWQQFRVDPPQRELTQRERDEALVKGVFDGKFQLGERVHVYEVMREAIYAERREVAKLMEEIHGKVTWEHGQMWNDGLVKLRARLSEQGTK